MENFDEKISNRPVDVTLLEKRSESLTIKLDKSWFFNQLLTGFKQPEFLRISHITNLM